MGVGVNFTPVGFIEPFELISSLKERMGLFQGTGGLRTLHLRAPRKAEPDEYGDTRDFARWREAQAVLERVEETARSQFKEELEFARVYLEMLDAAAGVAPRRVSPPYAARHLRLIVGVRSNPSAYLWCPPEQRVLTPGEVILTSPALWHGAINMGDYSRINLVIDVALPQSSSFAGLPKLEEVADAERVLQ